MTKSAPQPPDGLQAAGRRLWRAVSRDFELSQHELVVLKEASRTVDVLDALQARLDRDGLMSESSQGERVHPALPELRQQRIALARLLTALQIPMDDMDGRTQRRGGPRGVYPLRGA